MSAGPVADRYAQAIFELGIETGELNALLSGLSDFATCYKSSEPLRQALSDPLLSKDEKTRVVTQTAEKLRLSPLGIRSLLVMLARGRISVIGPIAQQLTQLHDQREGILRAKVTTATQMPEAYYDGLADQLKKATQRQIVLERGVDSDLVAGAVAQVGDTVLDASVRGRLKQLERDVLAALAAEAM